MTAGSISKGVIKDIIIVVVGVLVIWVGLQIVFGTQNPFYVVSSGSMVPILQVYDVLIVDGKQSFDEIEIGDIIVFNRPAGHDRVIVHRVVTIIDDEPFTIRTKGDANPASIPGTDFPITEEEYIGQVAYVVPQVGYITRILTPPINYIIIAVIIGIMIFKQISKSKKEKKFSFDRLDIESQSSDDKPSVRWNELDEISPDNAYTNSEKKDDLEKEESKEVTKSDENIKNEDLKKDSEPKDESKKD